MVMRNRHDDGANAPGWWDDLPPNVRKRCSSSPHREGADDSDPFSGQTDGSSRTGVAWDLSWLALVFVIIALANILFLLAALTFLHGRGLFSL